MLQPGLLPYLYSWPRHDSIDLRAWRAVEGTGLLRRSMPETAEQVRADSRWPALFPSPLCIVTTSDGRTTAMEKVVGPSIVNRFPYVLALSFCRSGASGRHHARAGFLDLVERGGQVAVQFFEPGVALDMAMRVISSFPDSRTGERVAATGLATRRAVTNGAPVFRDAYLVYEGRFVSPCRDREGVPVLGRPYLDVGSHRVLLFEISAIQLRGDVAEGRRAILWESLPEWVGAPEVRGLERTRETRNRVLREAPYCKSYTPHYRFPAESTVAFEPDGHLDGMAVRELPSLPEDQIEVDNERARWPCFFPSSAGIITSRTRSAEAAVMPCGSTAVVSRHPFVIAPCVSYSAINERYAPRATLDAIRHSRRFACGVPYASDAMVEFITFTGNVSLKTDRDKLPHAGLAAAPVGASPVLLDLPITFDCLVVDEVRLGTHVMFLGEVQDIYVRADLSPVNRLNWCPWAALSA